MGMFFISQEEKDEMKRRREEIAASRKQEEEARAAKRAQADMERLDQIVSQYGLSDLSSEDKLTVEKILHGYRGSGLIDWGSLLSGDDSSKLWNIQAFINMQVQQNWLIIKQLQAINDKLDSLKG